MAGYIGTAPVPQATQHRETFTATASQTSFATAGYTVGFLDVFLNGVKLVNGDDFTATNGSDVVLTSGAASGDILEVISYSTFEVNSQTFTGTTTLTGDLQATTATFSGAVTGTDATLSGGVYLGGTGAANKLDDYETGTWTPTAGSGSVTVNSATYTKIGDLVHLSARLDNFTDTTTNATLKVNGLPFTRATGTEAVGSLVGNNLGDAEITAVFTQTTYLEFYASSSTTSYNALKYNELGAPNQMYFSVTYRAA